MNSLVFRFHTGHAILASDRTVIQTPIIRIFIIRNEVQLSQVIWTNKFNIPGVFLKVCPKAANDSALAQVINLYRKVKLSKLWPSSCPTLPLACSIAY